MLSHRLPANATRAIKSGNQTTIAGTVFGDGTAGCILLSDRVTADIMCLLQLGVPVCSDQLTAVSLAAWPEKRYGFCPMGNVGAISGAYGAGTAWLVRNGRNRRAGYERTRLRSCTTN